MNRAARSIIVPLLIIYFNTIDSTFHKQLQSAREQDVQDAAATQEKMKLLQEAMAAAEEERLQMHRSHEEQQEESHKIYNQLNAQIEDIRQQAAHADAEKEHHKQALIAAEKEEKEKRRVLTEEMSSLSNQLEGVKGDRDHVRQSLQCQLEDAQREFQAFKDQHAKEVAHLEEKFRNKEGLYCSLM